MYFHKLTVALAVAALLGACSQNPTPAQQDAAAPAPDTAAVADPAPVPTPSHTTEQEAKDEAKETGRPTPPASDTPNTGGQTTRPNPKAVPPSATPPIVPPPNKTPANKSGGGMPMPVSDAGEPEPAAIAEAQPPSHAPWNTLLAKHVSAAGRVDYRSFQADRAALQAYLDALAAAPPEASWPRAEKMAYWINAYNAFTIKLIVDNLPVSSITKLDGGKPWDVRRIALGGRKYSLNEIENEILRPQFKDARIHFALNCAARSCPPLDNQAFTAANLERQLAARTKAFINDNKFNRLEPGKAQVSKLFDWYGGDFGDVRAFINRYAQTRLAENATVEFLEYDWSLND